MAETQRRGDDTRCGFVALIGAPNAGKSTLLNGLVGSKVSIISHKVQTTRALIRGIAVEGQSQLIFVDTPGIFSPRRRLDRAMVTTAWSGAHEADLVGVLIDSRKGLEEEADSILARPGEGGQRRCKIRSDVHGFSADRRRRRRSQGVAGATCSTRAVALSARADVRRPDPAARGGN